MRNSILVVLAGFMLWSAPVMASDSISADKPVMPDTGQRASDDGSSHPALNSGSAAISQNAPKPAVFDIDGDGLNDAGIDPDYDAAMDGVGTGPQDVFGDGQVFGTDVDLDGDYDIFHNEDGQEITLTVVEVKDEQRPPAK